jgi:hypothetical protein
MNGGAQWAISELLPILVVPKVLPRGCLVSTFCWIWPYLLLIILMTSGWSQLGSR